MSEQIQVLAGPHSVKTAEDFLRMPQEYQELATRLMLVHTEGEMTGADDYVQIFYPLAPDAYEKMICCERAAEEVQHYMLGAKVLAEIGIDTADMVHQKILDRNYYPNELVRGVETWMERGIFSYLGESVVLDHLQEFAESSYLPFAQIFLDQIIKDEHVHVAHGYCIVRDACRTEEGRVEAQKALDRFWPAVLDLFGRSDSPRSRAYVKWGLRKTLNHELREAFIARMKPKLEALGLQTPDDMLNRKFI